jgi:putative DNA primase/helicase
MSALEAALDYAGRGYRVFPCIDKNTPLVKWRDEASTSIVQIVSWFERWPKACIGSPTGEVSVVLDVDQPSGLDTLEGLGWPFLVVTPTVHTPRGGLHAHFQVPPTNIRNTAGKRGRGIGVCLDWRGLGGYTLLPSPGSGYSWDPELGPDTPLAEVPPELLPREPEVINSPPRNIPLAPSSGLDAYAEAALDAACRLILDAPNGEQEATLNHEAFAIGTLAGAGGIPTAFARDTLKWAAGKLVSYDARRPWRPGEAEAKADRAFDAGMRHPRGARRYG